MKLPFTVLWQRYGTLDLLSFYSQCKQVIERLIDRTSTYCSNSKICANKSDLNSLKNLIIDGLYAPQTVLLENFQLSFIFAIIFSRSFILSRYLITRRLSNSTLELSKLTKIETKIDKFQANKCYYHITCKIKFLCLNNRFSEKWRIFMSQNAFSASQKFTDVRLKKENFAECVEMLKLCQDSEKNSDSRNEIASHYLPLYWFTFFQTKTIVFYVKI